MAGGTRLLDHGRVLLRHVIHLRDGRVDFADPRRLFVGRSGNRIDDIVDARDIAGDPAKRITCCRHQLHTAAHFVARAADQRLDILGGTGGATCEFAHFLRNDGKTLARLTGPRGLDPGIERQEVGLKGDLVDHIDDLADFARCILDPAHRRHGFRHDLRGLFCARFRATHHLHRLGSAFGRVLHRRGNLLERRGGLFERRSLLFRALGEIFGRIAHLGAVGVDRGGVRRDIAEHLLKLLDRTIEVAAHLLEIGPEWLWQRDGQVTICEPVEARTQGIDRKADLGVFFELDGLACGPLGVVLLPLQTTRFRQVALFDRRLAQRLGCNRHLAELVAPILAFHRRVEILAQHAVQTVADAENTAADRRGMQDEQGCEHEHAHRAEPDLQVQRLG